MGNQNDIHYEELFLVDFRKIHPQNLI